MDESIDEVLPGRTDTGPTRSPGATTRPRRRSMAVAATVVLVLVAAVVAAVLTTGARQRGPAAAPLAKAARPAPLGRATRLAASVRCHGWPITAPGVTRRPATRMQLEAFRPVTAVRCTGAERRYPDGLWSVTIRQVSTSELNGLLAALDRADETAPPDTSCAAYADSDPELLLVDASGRFLRPRYPRDGCGHLQPAATKATVALRWHQVALVKLNLDVPNDPILRACGRASKDVIDLEAARAKLGPGAAVSGAGTSIACFYRRTSDPIAGYYRRGVRLDAGQTAALSVTLSGAGRPGACSAQRDFAVIHFGGAFVYVELGGCWRVLRADDTLGRADPAAVRRILGL